MWDWATPTLPGGFGGWLSVVVATSAGGAVFASGAFPPKAPSLAGTRPFGRGLQVREKAYCHLRPPSQRMRPTIFRLDAPEASQCP